MVKGERAIVYCCFLAAIPGEQVGILNCFCAILFVKFPLLAKPKLRR